MTTPLRLLLVEDSPYDAELVIHELKRAGFEVSFERVQTAEALREALGRGGWQAVISDWSMPQFSGLAALKVFKEAQIDIPFILASGTVGEESAVEAMRAGAQDYVLKDRLTRLGPAMRRELQECQARAGQRQAEQARREAEQQLRQSQKLEAVGRLAGAVAHDFNNLLLVILGYSEMLLQNAELPAGMREDITEIREAGKRASALTRQLLLLSRQQVIAPKVLDLNEVVSGVEKMLRRLIGEDVELVAVRGAELGRVRADPGYVEQVLMNLVVNARDAMPRGGKITIATRNVVLDEGYAQAHPGAQAGPHVLVAVSDTGTGIPPAIQAKIFEPFFTTKEPGKGTGLGLSTVMGIVREAGGSIALLSEEGRGTTFEVYLPALSTPAAATTEARPEVASAALRGTERILVVEDEPAVRALACDILKRAGYRVTDARNPVEAFDHLDSAAHPVQLVLSDVVMPQMSGPELASRLADEYPDVKVLCMSGYTDDTVVRNGMIEANVPFLQKPFTPQTLLEKIREVLDGRRAAG